MTFKEVLHNYIFGWTWKPASEITKGDEFFESICLLIVVIIFYLIIEAIRKRRK